MELIIESNRLEDYLRENPPVISFNTPLVNELIRTIKSRTDDPLQRAKIAFEFVRDEVHHSFDAEGKEVIITSEDALKKKEGICFAKSHLLASLLRGMGIPTGFCYQRVLRKGTVENGYALHGLNAAYTPATGWFRLDPRGNKPGVDSQFSTNEEKLAYPIRENLGEVDYPVVYAEPLTTVIKSMEESKDCNELFYKRPDSV